MTYLQFHLVFILPPLLVLLLTLRNVAARLGRRALWVLPVMAVIAFVYTTPWDNYLVYRGVWGYGADRVIGTIGYVPIEEYLFFVLQPLLTGAWTYHVLTRTLVQDATDAPSVRTGDSLLDGLADSRIGGAMVYWLCAAAGFFALTTRSGLYLGLILVWAAPVLALQWPFIAGAVSAAPRSFAAAVLVPTLYLWVADRIAIGSGIWSISAEYTTGLHLFGLPVEEAVFFLVTNLLVVQGVLLFLAPVRVAATVAAEPMRAAA
jgi:lycopene beta-cyclase